MDMYAIRITGLFSMLPNMLQKPFVRNLPFYYLHGVCIKYQIWKSTWRVFTIRKYVFSAWAASRNIKKVPGVNTNPRVFTTLSERCALCTYLLYTRPHDELAILPAHGDYHFGNKFTGCRAAEFSKPFFWESIERRVNARAAQLEIGALICMHA